MHRRILLTLPATLALAACLPAQPTSQPTGETTPFAGPWRLIRLNGRRFDQRATISFGTDGTLTGDGPCNQWGGRQTAVQPAFRAEDVYSTMVACTDDAANTAEADFHAALRTANQIAYTGRGMTLAGPNGVQMDFTRDG
ncbi:META domain-containing protein [Paracoccus sp. p4-l81]|uniref:META domain-containing protein n=1 Tax=unclassified Paracoccus (in: a-proteobacteria) TaxID=2688777 RepID=UPI0035B8C317